MRASPHSARSAAPHPHGVRSRHRDRDGRRRCGQAGLRGDGRKRRADPGTYIGAVKGYYTTTDGEMLSLPFNSSTPVRWVNRDAMSAAGVDPGTDMSTWEQVDDVLGLKAGGELPACHSLAKLDPSREFLRLSQRSLRIQGQRLRRSRPGLMLNGKAR